MASEVDLPWPPKMDVFGVQISATDYEQVVTLAIAAAQDRRPATISLLPVHGVITAVQDPQYRAKINGVDIVAPDGQPVRWAMNSFHHAGLVERVYGPEVMRRLCAAAAEEGVGVYLFGSTEEVLERLAERLPRMFPGLRIVGMESPPFRPMTPDEDAAAVERINRSGAGIVFLGMGCPRQEAFAYEHRERIQAVQVCVGAAFDFHAGTKSMAPPWMQSHGLEWLYRLVHEPRRLWRRYLVTNTHFVLLFARRLLRGK